MGPDKPLPHSDAFATSEAYVDSLLNFVGTNALLRTLCGGVHVLDFFTSDPPLYDRVIPQEWRDFFHAHDIHDILDLLMREDLAQFQFQFRPGGECEHHWRNGPTPPQSLLDYIETVRRHLLLREPSGSQCARNRAMKPTQKLARHVAVGMNVKKVHEVGLFAHYIDELTENITTSISDSTGGDGISHLVDFGSGQNYLGRALASAPYHRRIVAIESQAHNAERAKEFDVMAKLAAKKVILRNKKAFRAGLEGGDGGGGDGLLAGLPTPPPEPAAAASEGEEQQSELVATGTMDPTIALSGTAKGAIQYIEHRIQDGDLSAVIPRIANSSPPTLMIISLHSCGNLVHHGLRALLHNPAVRAVALVGCCYNLLTERLGPATHKHPSLRPTTHGHARLEATGAACDPHGFPMSERLCTYDASGGQDGKDGQGIRLNITARMMAVQAPQNWGERDSEAFFTRHFYRALLQRIFLDRGVVGPPSSQLQDHGIDGGGDGGGGGGGGGDSPAGHSSGGTPIIIGSLGKSCYANFTTYVRGALAKLYLDADRGQDFRQKMGGLTDEEIGGYHARFCARKKELSVVWSLMAFSAGAVEAAIVVDRWLWLREQEGVREAWVEAVFDYRVSPRNLVVVGVKG
ncbi:hypothetical protein LTR36_004473 [Oleoguttula mirabilis]|uniref:Methyltransferase domain-containing protein n=1 Tax=Oleoguttula mirabilis TaxID=1507867 RepID=A0AAV9JG14_9PEZI|nr:hypothetical protein LTR36_004473 [Oleoguttula mirabilis]